MCGEKSGRWRNQSKYLKEMEVKRKRVRNNSEDIYETIHRRDDKSMKLTNYAISQMG